MALLHEINNGTERFSVASDGSVKVNNAFTFPTAVTTTANYVLTAQTDGSTAWAADSIGMEDWIIAGDTGTTTITDGDTMTIAGGTNVTTSESAGTVTINAALTGYVQGTGTATRVAFWSASDTISSHADFYWDNVNDRLGIGVGSAPLKKLNVQGTVRIQTNTNYYSDRTYLGDTWEFASDTTDGVTFSITGGLAATAGNYFRWLTQEGAATPIERMRITSSGNVGIGTATPTQGKVDILDAGAYSAHTGHGLTINSNASNAYTSMYMGADDTIDAIYIQSAGRNTSFTTKKLLLNPNGGNVGIGTTSPGSLLHIKGETKAYIQFEDTTDGVIGFVGDAAQMLTSGTVDNLGLRGEGGIQFGVSDVIKMVLDSSGNVGIGTTSPDYQLESRKSITYSDNIVDGDAQFSVASSASQRMTFGYDNVGNGFGYIKTGNQGLAYTPLYINPASGVAGGVSIGYQPSVATPPSQGLLVQGNVGIGTTSPSTLLNLEKSVDAFQALLIESTATWPVSNAAGSRFQNSSGSLYMFVDNGGGDYGPTGGTGAASAYAGNFRLTGAYPMQFATSDTLRMTIAAGGDVGINDSTPSYKLDVDGTIRATGDVIAYSDKRVKENIKTIDNSLEKVSKLRGVSYTRKDIDDKSTKIGVIAQEVIDVLPEVVSQDDKGKYSVAYGNISGLLIESIKELKAEIEELKSKPCNCNNCDCKE